MLLIGHGAWRGPRVPALFLQDEEQLCREGALGILLGGRSEVHPKGWSTQNKREGAREQPLMGGTGSAAVCASLREDFRDAQPQHAVVQS